MHFRCRMRTAPHGCRRFGWRNLTSSHYWKHCSNLIASPPSRVFSRNHHFYPLILLQPARELALTLFSPLLVREVWAACGLLNATTDALNEKLRSSSCGFPLPIAEGLSALSARDASSAS